MKLPFGEINDNKRISAKNPSLEKIREPTNKAALDTYTQPSLMLMFMRILFAKIFEEAKDKVVSVFPISRGWLVYM